MRPDDFAKARLSDLIYDFRTWGLREEAGRFPIEVVADTGTLRVRGRFVVPPPAKVPHDVYVDISETWQPYKRHLYALQRSAAATREGFWLDGFSYQLVVDDVRWRYDLDFDRHPNMALHEHPRGQPEDKRVPFTPWTTGDLVTAGDNGLVERLMAEFVKALGPWPPDDDDMP